jgi:hypothetical protein
VKCFCETRDPGTLAAERNRIRGDLIRGVAASALAVAVVLQGALICSAAQAPQNVMVGCSSACPVQSGSHRPSCCQASSHPVQLQVTRVQPVRSADFAAAVSAVSFPRATLAECVAIRAVSSRPPPSMLTLERLCSLQI